MRYHAGILTPKVKECSPKPPGRLKRGGIFLYFFMICENLIIKNKFKYNLGTIKPELNTIFCKKE